MTTGELWHIVEAKREDGTPAIFRICELEPRPTLPRIFVIEWPYPITELSRLPNAAAYRKLATFEEQWLLPACAALGWVFVGSKTEDGSFFLYVYGDGDPKRMIERLSPFDAGLGFFDDDDPDWEEYAELTMLLERAKAIPKGAMTDGAESGKTTTSRSKSRAKSKPKAKGKTALKKARGRTTLRAAVKPAKQKLTAKLRAGGPSKTKPPKRKARG